MIKKTALVFVLLFCAFSTYAVNRLTAMNNCIERQNYFMPMYYGSNQATWPSNQLCRQYDSTTLIAGGTYFVVFQYYNPAEANCTSPYSYNITTNTCDLPAPITCTLPQIRNYNISSGTYNTCLTPPTDYICNVPNSWITLTDDSWRCTNTATIPTGGGANTVGVSGVANAYAPESFTAPETCDPEIPYACVTMTCDFWSVISLTNTLCF